MVIGLCDKQSIKISESKRGTGSTGLYPKREFQQILARRSRGYLQVLLYSDILVILQSA